MVAIQRAPHPFGRGYLSAAAALVASVSEMAVPGIWVPRVLFLATVLVGVINETAFGQHAKPFFDPACFVKDCSWSWDEPAAYAGTQSCTRDVYNKSLDICPNPFGYSSSPDGTDRPSKAKEVTVTEFNKLFNSSEQYTCLNVTYKIDRSSAEKVKGLQLSVTGMDDPDLGDTYCLNLNFTEDGLGYYAVEDREFSIQCLCGLRPGRPYDVIVRTMPVADNSNDPEDTAVLKHFTPAGCNDPSKANDVRCWKSIEALWTPKCLTVKQKTESGEYDIVEVSFDVAPDSYEFDKYRIFINKHLETASPVDFADIDMNTATIESRTCLTSPELGVLRFVTHRFNTTRSYAGKPWEGDPFIAEMRPMPTGISKCRNAEDEETPCTMTKTGPFSVIADPCKGNPCGEHGTCQLEEEMHRCKCQPGYMEWDNTCQVDPCQVLASSGTDWISQCEHGECMYTWDRTDFYCHCNKGNVYLKGSKKCAADPCAENPKTNMTVCGAHGGCNFTLTDDSVDHMCICNPGFSDSHGECKEDVSVGMIVGVVAASCLAGLLLFFTAFCLYRYYKRREDPQHTEIPTGLPPPPHERFSYKRVLPIYSDDHPCHKEVVHCFCRFLQEHCRCTVSFLDWQTSIGPTLEMWLSTEIEKADIVLLLCSKGTGKKYKARAKRDNIPSNSFGVYGDIFVKALTLLDVYFSRNNAEEKFVVAYFDYSSEDDIPVSFKRFAKYRLMQYMETLFLRIHGKLKDSPHSRRRVPRLDEGQYMNLEMGEPLHRAIEAMKEAIRADSNWYQNYHNNNQSSDSPRKDYRRSKSQPPALDSQSPGPSFESGYNSSNMPNWDFLNDGPSSRRSSNGSNFQKSFDEFMNLKPKRGDVGIKLGDFQDPRMPQHDSGYVPPETRLFTNDIHLTMNPGSDNQSNQFYSDIQMGDMGRDGSLA